MRRCIAVFAAVAVASFACADVHTANPARKAFTGTLAVDIRGAVDVSLTQTSSDDLDVTLAFGEGYGLLDPSKPLTAHGKIERFPESPGWEMYTARFSGGTVAGGPCGALPVSLAMSLTRRDGNARVSGAVTAYCGASVFAGIPARVLRVAGKA